MRPNELDDIREQAEIVGKLTPREYAKLRDVAPQLIYYYIRTGILDLEYCVCGRRVLDVQASNEALEAKARSRGKKLDTRPDSDSETGHSEMV